MFRARRIATKFGLDIMNPNDFNSLMQSLGLRAAYVFAMVEDHAKELKINEEEFERRLQGEGVLDSMSDCLLQECSDFFQRFGQSAMARLAKTSIDLMQRARKYTAREEFQSDLDREIAKVFDDGNV